MREKIITEMTCVLLYMLYYIIPLYLYLCTLVNESCHENREGMLMRRGLRQWKWKAIWTNESEKMQFWFVALGLLLHVGNEGIETVEVVVMHTSLNTHILCLCKCYTLVWISEPCRFLREYFGGSEF